MSICSLKDDENSEWEQNKTIGLQGRVILKATTLAFVVKNFLIFR
jgi:hypothetical protein